jgi:hypothetical protein
MPPIILWISSSFHLPHRATFGMNLGEIPGVAARPQRHRAAWRHRESSRAGRLPLEAAVLAGDAAYAGVLFGLMVISARSVFGGLYTDLVKRIAAHPAGSRKRSC